MRPFYASPTAAFRCLEFPQQKLIMSTGHERALQEHAVKAMHHPDWAMLMAETLRKLESGHYDNWFVDCLMQEWPGRKARYDLYDAYAFLIFWSDILHGDVAFAVIGVSEPPQKDHAIGANNSILTTLPPPFRASFYGGRGDDDGELAWDSAITLTKIHLDALGRQIKSEEPYEPSYAPLEVGYTKASRTLTHLRTEGALARWPYKHDRIGLFIQPHPGVAYPSELRPPPGYLFPK